MGAKTDPLSGRGARTNATGRFEPDMRSPFDDGWTDRDPAAPRIDTIIAREAARTIISHNDSPDISFDQSINTYRGCEHGCIYCYARPNHAYVNLSPGLDFESRIFVKAEAAQLLERELAAPGYRCRVIVLGGATDVYQPAERGLAVTRAVLRVAQRFNQPVGLITKSALIVRDLDILAPMAERRLAKAAVSLTTLDPKLARIMEPRAAAPHRRLETIRTLSKAGVPVTVMTAPLIPRINDHEIERLLAAAHDAGARQAGYVVLRLPLEIADLFGEWLGAHFPDRAAHVMALVAAMRGGRAYEPSWGARQKGAGAYAKLIADRFRRACAKLGFNAPAAALDTSQFTRPARAGEQLALDL